jgi:prefoldin alpha subunit
MKEKKHKEESREKSPEEKQKEMQGKIMEINMLENRLKQMEQSLNFVDQQIMEQQMIQMDLDELKKAKKGNEMLFPLGKNVFVKGKLENHEVLVNIGGNIVVKQDEDKAKEAVERQKLQLSGIRDEITREVEKIINRISIIEQSLRM